jgi:hypothetical protein
MTDDEWHAQVTREAAKAIGAWLEARGRLHQPIHCLTMHELEAMATAAIGRFVLMGWERIRTGPPDEELTQFLLA